MRLKLTREGWVQPWVQVTANEQEEEKRLARRMPPFQSVQSDRVDQAGSFGPGGGRDRGGRLAAGGAAVQPFGRGAGRLDPDRRPVAMGAQAG